MLHLLTSKLESVFTPQNKNLSSHLSNTHSAYQRLTLWNNSVQMTKENFIFGVGAGNWQVHFPKYGLDKFDVTEIKNGITTFQRPHNDFLWVFCETGIIGIITYILIFIVVIYYLIKLLKQSNKLENNSLYSAFVAGIIGYVIIAFVDFPLERIEHQLLLYLIFSVVTAHFYTEFKVLKNSKKTILVLPIFLFLLFIPIILSFVVSNNRFSGEYHTHQLYKFYHEANWNQMIKETDKAINCCYIIDPMSVPIEWYKGVALFSLGNIHDAETSFEKAYSINPYNISVLSNLASCYENLKKKKCGV